MKPSKLVTTVSVCGAWLVAVVAAGPAAAGAGLVVAFGPEGLSELSFGGESLLATNARPALSVTDADGRSSRPALATGGVRQVKGTLTQTYDTLTVTTQMRPKRDALNLTVTYQNTGTEAVTRIEDQPIWLRFPKRPKGGAWKWGYDNTVDTEGAPGVVVADWGMSKVAVCVDPGSAAPKAADATRPMSIGFAGNYGNSPLNAVVFRTTFQPPLAPGRTWTFRASLRFAESATPTAKVVADLYTKFARAYPFTLNWPDRRPIGALMACQSAMHWPTNPRGWLNDPQIDVTTEAGRKVFRERMLKYADTSIAVIKDTGGQGMIMWSVEGEQMPHAITYLGDPRVLPQSAPEMNAVADEFFGKFRTAGLRTGVCIRPSRVISDGKGGWKHRQVEDHVSELADKIAYAKKRWGCTIFYMDTNVKWPMNPDPADTTRGMWQGNAALLSSADLRELCRRHPDVLIFPEFGRFGYWSVCGVYGELRGGATRTRADVRTVYPRACSVLQIGDGDYLGRWDDLREGVMAGDIHLFRGWFGDPYNTLVKRMYQEVDFLRRSRSVRKTGPLEVRLSDPDPLVRFVAVSEPSKPDAAQTELLIKVLEAESEWVVQRRIVEALGALGEAAAVPVLADLLQEGKRGLDGVAAVALGRIGAAATRTLVNCATNQDPRVSQLALTALAQNDEPAATLPLLALSESPVAKVRALAVRALGRRPAPAVTARLVALLSDSDPSVVVEACASLGRLQDRAAVKPLVSLVMRSVTELHNNQIREAAGDALEAITGLQCGPFERQWQKALDEGKI